MAATATVSLPPCNPGPREPMTVVDFPDQLRNDIFYCQRVLKEHIKIHQFCAVQNAIKPSKRYATILKSVEAEIQGIAQDQQLVIDTMKRHLSGLHQKLVDGSNNNPNGGGTDDFDNKIIRSYLDMHRPSIGGLALQSTGFVKARATEKELIRQHDLLSDLQLFMRPTSVIEQRLPLSPQRPLTRPAPGTPGKNPNQVSESRRKFLAALKAVKPQTKREELDSDEEVEFLSEGPLIYHNLHELQRQQEEKEQEQELAEVKEGPKRNRGRPRKSKLGLLNNHSGSNNNNNSGSAASTRANSPEVVTMPYVDLPAEPLETNDFDQTGFMQRLGLFTTEMATFLRNKRPERRRRTVQSTEKTDYHYGQLDFQNNRITVLVKNSNNNKRPTQQYLSPRTFKKRKTFDRSASSSPPNDATCTCSSSTGSRNGGGRSPCSKCGRKAAA